MVLIAPLTEEPSAIGFPGTVAIEGGNGSGLPAPVTAMVFQLRAVDRSRFIEKVGEVREPVLNEVLGEVDRLTGRTPRPLD